MAGKPVPPDFCVRRDTTNGGYFFLPADSLAATAADFFAASLSDLDCFWPDFFWFAFGDLSPMMFCFLLLRLTRLRDECFPAGTPSCGLAARL